MKPPESFVPLTAAPAPSAPQEFRVAVLNGHHHGQGEKANGSQEGVGGESSQPPAGMSEKRPGFQSLESSPAPMMTSVGSMEKKLGEPRVTVQRDGDRVTHLRIQCTCGQILELACVYDGPRNGNSERR